MIDNSVSDEGISPGDAKKPEDSMVGDANLFFYDEEDPSIGEINIMVCEPTARRKGIGEER